MNSDHLVFSRRSTAPRLTIHRLRRRNLEPASPAARWGTGSGRTTLHYVTDQAEVVSCELHLVDPISNIRFSPAAGETDPDVGVGLYSRLQFL
jgi:hypothetical protein